MAHFFLLIFVALSVVHYSLAKPSGDGKGRNRHRLDDEDIEKIKNRCKDDPSSCKGQKEHHKQKRQGIKNAIHNNLKAGGKSHDNAEKEAEEQLQKIHELKVKIHEAMGISFVEPPDDGVFGGDMVLTKDQAQRLIKDLEETESKSKRAAAIFFSSPPYDKWPSFPIHYWINSSVGWSEKDKAIIRDAINTLSYNYTSACLSFVEDAAPAADNQIQYSKDNWANHGKDTGCWSFVGFLGPGPPIPGLPNPAYPNPVNLGNGCVTKGIVMHETIHALGGGHEHQRPDRDPYITVLMDNVHPDYYANFYKSTTSTSYGFPYRITSVMHYAWDAFTRNGQPTIINKATNKPDIMNNENLTLDDINQLNRMYCNLKDPCYDSDRSCGDDALAGKCLVGSDTMAKCPMSCNQCGLRIVM